MTTVSITCPICLQADAIQFFEGTENGAPHGAGYWPMQVSDINQDCDCDISEEQLTELSNIAWKPIQAEYDAYAQELEAVMRELDDYDATPTQPVYHAPGCYCPEFEHGILSIPSPAPGPDQSAPGPHRSSAEPASDDL